jgi:hypothetical protein
MALRQLLPGQMNVDPTAALMSLRSAVDRTDTACLDLELEDALIALATLRSEAKRLQDLAAFVERAALALLPHGRFERDGLFAEVRPPAVRYTEWDDAAVMNEVLRLLPHAAEPSAITRHILRAQRPGWRTSVLRELAVDLDGRVRRARLRPTIDVRLVAPRR